MCFMKETTWASCFFVPSPAFFDSVVNLKGTVSERGVREQNFC